jgi:mannose-6-phosphate isomerase-like protein (cupin superfamily)
MEYKIGASESVAKILKKGILTTEKRWGEENTYMNEKYCLKTLTIKSSSCGSMHFHIDKHETLLVISGALLLKTIHPVTTEPEEYLVNPLEAVVVPPGFLHQLCALTSDVLLVEASTYDNSKDSIRVHM